MLISLSQVLTRDGKQMTFESPIDMDVFSTSFGVYPIAEKTPVHLTVTHSHDKKLHITGDFHLVLEIPCDRCLEPVAYPFDLSIETDVDMNESDEQRVKELDEQVYIRGNELDVDKLVGAELIVNMPMKVLCKQDCRGICNKCGRNLNYGSCDCDTTVEDPRMAAIRDLFKNFKEV